MHIKWIPPITTNKRRKHLGSSRASQQIGRTKHVILGEKVLCLHGLDIIHRERLFLMNFIFLLFLKKKNER